MVQGMMSYFLVITSLLWVACGGEQPAARTKAIEDAQSSLGLQALPQVADKQAYRLVICAKASGVCRDALQTKDGRGVTFIYDIRSQHLISDSDAGAVVSLKHLAEAQTATARRGRQRQSLVVWPLIAVGITAGVLLLPKISPTTLTIALMPDGKSVPVHPPEKKVGRKYIAGGVGALVAAVATWSLDHYVWGHGERQAAQHWDSIFSAAEHKNATTVKDLERVVEALAKTFDLVAVKDR